MTGDTIKRNEQSLALAQRSNPRVFSRANIALRLTSGLSSIETNPEPRLSTERLRWGNRGDIASLLSQASNSATSGGFDVVIGAEVTYLSASLDPLLSTMEELLSSSVLVTPESQRHSMQVLGDGPVGLLTYTPHLTAFDGGGVAELEDKARKHGLHVTHFRSDPDVDTRLMALTLMSAEEKSSSDTPMGSARSVS